MDVHTQEHQGLLSTAQNFQEAGKYDQAVGCYSRALELVEGKDPRAESSVRLARASLLFQLGQWPGALRDCERIVGLAGPGAVSEAVKARQLAAQIYAYSGEYALARQSLEQGVELATSQGSPGEQATVHFELGSILTKIGEAEQGRAHLDRARQLLGGLQGPEAVVLQVRLHLEEGTAAFRQGRHTQARQAYEKAFELARRELSRSPLEAEVYRALGILASVQGHYLEALRSHMRALEIFRAARMSLGEGKCYSSIGQVCLELSRVDEAFLFMDRARQIFVRLGADAEVASLYGKMGIIYREREELDRAVEFHLKDVELCRRFGNRRALAFAFQNLGLSYRARGELEEARRYLQESRRRFEELGDQARAGRVRLDLAETWQSLGHPAEAEEELELAAASLEGKPSPDLARLWILQGAICRQQHRYSEAGLKLMQAQSLLGPMPPSPLHAELHLELASLYTAVPEPPKAIDHLRQALVLARQMRQRRLAERAVKELDRLDQLELVRLLVDEVGREG
ncbi:MAG TPA: tetratricopeptide repeat protein [Candidatus Nitrosotenuis sp.]|jgi:tetratricopeptide (TPR) repeat protein|nr:tetratricopeptide repeat protein [Candidatus Nitrosotenuis sp.]